MQDTLSELTSNHIPFLVTGIDWDFSGDDSEVEYDSDDHDLPHNIIVWMEKDDIAEVDDDESELISMIIDQITDDYGWCINDVEVLRKIDPREAEGFLFA